MVLLGLSPQKEGLISSEGTLCSSLVLLCFTTQKEGLPSKRLVKNRQGPAGSTHFLQLLDAGCVHYDLAGCTFTPGERFLLENEKRGGNMHVKSSIQRLASSASHHTSFIYFRVQNKSCRKVRHNVDFLK